MPAPVESVRVVAVVSVVVPSGLDGGLPPAGEQPLLAGLESLQPAAVRAPPLSVSLLPIVGYV